MANYKKEIDEKIVGPNKSQHNVPMAFDGLSGKVAKELPDGALTVEKIEPLDPQKVVVTETDGTLATSNITTTELGYLQGLEKNVVTTIQEISAAKPNIYSVTFGYSGNAVVGRYLEKFSGIDTSEVGDIVPVSGKIIAIAVGAKDSAGDFTISGYKSPDLRTPIFSYILYSGLLDSYSTSFAIPVSAGDKLVLKVTNGSRNKPIITYFLDTRRL